jgi:hypothetical protein
MAIPGMYDPLGRRTGSGVLKVIVIFGIVIFGIIMVFGGTASNVSGHSHDVAQKAANQFVSSIPGAAAHCVQVDSDGDGYISCPYTTPDGNAHPLECAGGFNINNGCRIPKVIVGNPIGR